MNYHHNEKKNLAQFVVHYWENQQNNSARTYHIQCSSPVNTA
jgi:hypothetical protein